MKGQLIECSTSVASNYRATCLVQSKAAFISKISIVNEEADEYESWLEFIINENLIPKDKAGSLRKEAHELASISLFQEERLKGIMNERNDEFLIFINRHSTILIPKVPLK